jgi:hypothetical protein
MKITFESPIKDIIHTSKPPPDSSLPLSPVFSKPAHKVPAAHSYGSIGTSAKAKSASWRTVLLLFHSQNSNYGLTLRHHRYAIFLSYIYNSSTITTLLCDFSHSLFISKRFNRVSRCCPPRLKRNR